MENKYFIPDIEDVCIGYELEIRQANEWLSHKIQSNDCFCDFVEMDGYRVPYLTKEQIEAEGWNFETVLFEDDDENDVYSDGFVKHIDQDHWYEMVLQKDNKIHIVYKWYRNSVTQLSRDIYYGECKDINTFRKIIKLLGR